MGKHLYLTTLSESTRDSPVMESTSPFAFLRVLEALKNIQRKGWAKRGIQSPESVSDHMYRMAVMVWMIPEIDDEIRMRAVKMAFQEMRSCSKNALPLPTLHASSDR